MCVCVCVCVCVLVAVCGVFVCATVRKTRAKCHVYHQMMTYQIVSNDEAAAEEGAVEDAVAPCVRPAGDKNDVIQTLQSRPIISHDNIINMLPIVKVLFFVGWLG